jgi:hypothetical protein
MKRKGCGRGICVPKKRCSDIGVGPMKGRVCRSDVRVICGLPHVVSGVRGGSRLSDVLMQAKGRQTDVGRCRSATS